MSTDSIIIHCSGCEYRYHEIFVPITIKCTIGDEIATYDHTTAWCTHCATIRYIEFLPDLDELQFEYDRRVRPLSAQPVPKSADCRFGSSKPLLRSRRYEGNITELKKRIIWRQARHAPPHCLTCGTADITLVDFEAISGSELISTNFRHSCGGALVIDYKDDPGIRFFEFDESVVWMDIEGNRLNDSEGNGENGKVQQSEILFKEENRKERDHGRDL